MRQGLVAAGDLSEPLSLLGLLALALVLQQAVSGELSLPPDLPDHLEAGLPLNSLVQEEAEGRDLPVGERLQITTPESGEEEVRWEEKKCSQYLSGKGGSLDFSAWGELAQD